jgi:hypothetical protein
MVQSGRGEDVLPAPGFGPRGNLYWRCLLSFLFVPDNPNYEGSVQLLFAEDNHPISLEQYQKLTEARQICCQWRRCYKMVTLLPTNREHYANGHAEIWFLVDTKEVRDPRQPRQEYHLRPSTEERYRQLKCFSDLTHFTSRAFSLVLNRVVFIMLAL